MTAKLPWILLALSLLFNFFFAGGFLHARDEWQPPETETEAVDLVSDRLELDEDQRRTLAELRRDAHERARRIRESIAQARQELWADINGGTVDRDRLNEVIEFEAEQRRQLKLLAGEHFRRFLGVLRPEQRRKMGQLLRRRAAARWRDAWPRQFDADGDGRLDEQEKAAAHKAYERRMDQFRRRHHDRLLERFDTDGDGRLSEAERAEAREFFRTRRPGRRPETRTHPAGNR